ncbi:MAG: hypothetical protein KJN90_05265 [Gammaproteobacteria bacterium]|nr:hypothetical protein [Gammaproteobacteria bacterium]
MQIVDLNTFDLIAIEGAEAKKFLQGQVTCDVDELSPSQSLQGAICNIKGRVIGDFRLLEFRDTCYLQLEAGMADKVKPVLDKYMVFSKAESRIATSEVRRYGVLGEPSSAALQSLFDPLPAKAGQLAVSDNAILVKAAGLLPRYEVWHFVTDETEQNKLVNDLANSAKASATESWRLEEIRAGIVHITPSLSEQHLPEALNYDISGVISFTKGCYTGQEIVARMYYRGTAKKRLYCSHRAGMSETPTSIEYLPAASQTAAAGEILSKASDKFGNWHVLTILPGAAAEADANVYLNGNSELTVELELPPYMTD